MQQHRAKLLFRAPTFLVFLALTGGFNLILHPAEVMLFA
jgi:hypothetical protein